MLVCYVCYIENLEEFIFKKKENYLENEPQKGTCCRGKQSPDRGKLALFLGEVTKEGQKQRGQEKRERMEDVLGRNAEILQNQFHNVTRFFRP